MTDRRSLITGFFAAAVAGPAFGEDLYLPPAGVSARADLYVPGGTRVPGVVGPRTLLAVIDGMRHVDEGRGKPKLRILFEFGCPRSPELHERTSRRPEAAVYAWIPIPPPEADPAAPAVGLFAPGADGRSLTKVFTGHRLPKGDAEAARRQGRFFLASVQPDLYRATALPFATPTVVYQGRDGETRIIRGSPDLGALRAIIASAS